MAKPRVHNEYFTTVLRGNRKSCPNCKAKLNGELIYSWFEYHRVQRYAIQDFCIHCWDEVRSKLLDHSGPCGCVFQLNAKGCVLPSWLTLDEEGVV